MLWQEQHQCVYVTSSGLPPITRSAVEAAAQAAGKQCTTNFCVPCTIKPTTKVARLLSRNRPHWTCTDNDNLAILHVKCAIRWCTLLVL
jgi:hypothetical protein